MSRTNANLIKAALRTIDATGAARLTAPLTRGIGAILMFHHVAPDPRRAFDPNGFLRITPEFLDDVVGLVRDMGYDTVSLDEIPARIAAGRDAKPFVAFTFDDGYRDNRDYALPVLRRHNVPMAIYVPSDYADGTGDLWWLALENAIRAAENIDIRIGEENFDLPASTDAEKRIAFHRIYWALRKLPEDDARRAVAELCRAAGYDACGLCRDLVMNWDELRELIEDPLVTIGAHTTGHYSLGKLEDDAAWTQMAENVERIETELDRACHHMSYPYGSKCACGPREFRFARRLGMRTAVTTYKGLIHPHHRAGPTALPRLSVNGDYQDLALIRTLLTGAPFALLDAYERLTSLPNAARQSFNSHHRLSTSTG